jgi:hypothetical protein
MPNLAVPIVAGSAVVFLALPIIAIGSWSLKGWALAAVLWVASQAFGLLLARLRLGGSNLAASGVVAFGMMFRGIAVMVVLLAIAVSDRELGLTAALVYALAYTLELGVAVISYFGGEPR